MNHVSITKFICNFRFLKHFTFILLLTIGFAYGSFAQSKISMDGNITRIIKFYPNPATTAINFDFQEGYDNSYSFLVFNFMGKKVFDIKNTASHTTINLEDFYRGIYIFQLRDKNGKVIESGKFQVIK